MSQYVYFSVPTSGNFRREKIKGVFKKGEWQIFNNFRNFAFCYKSFRCVDECSVDNYYQLSSYSPLISIQAPVLCTDSGGISKGIVPLSSNLLHCLH